MASACTAARFHLPVIPALLYHQEIDMCTLISSRIQISSMRKLAMPERQASA